MEDMNKRNMVKEGEDFSVSHRAGESADQLVKRNSKRAYDEIFRQDGGERPDKRCCLEHLKASLFSHHPKTLVAPVEISINDCDVNENITEESRRKSTTPSPNPDRIKSANVDTRPVLGCGSITEHRKKNIRSRTRLATCHVNLEAVRCASKTLHQAIHLADEKESDVLSVQVAEKEAEIRTLKESLHSVQEENMKTHTAYVQYQQECFELRKRAEAAEAKVKVLEIQSKVEEIGDNVITCVIQILGLMLWAISTKSDDDSYSLYD